MNVSFADVCCFGFFLFIKQTQTSKTILLVFLFFEVMKKNKGRKLTKKEFEAKQNWIGFWKLLLEIDTRNNSHLYEDNRNTNKNS